MTKKSVSLIQITIHLDATRGMKRFDVYADDGFKLVDGQLVEKRIGADSIDFFLSIRGLTRVNDVTALQQLLSKVAIAYANPSGNSVEVCIDETSKQILSDGC